MPPRRSRTWPRAPSRPVIGEIDEIDPKKVKRSCVACAGKVYYDVLAARRERKLDNVALLRIEQLYPFPTDVSPRR
jgi:2-oxoglutarate dehydrogenase E1 component